MDANETVMAGEKLARDVAVGCGCYILQTLEHIGQGCENLPQGRHGNLRIHDRFGIAGCHASLGLGQFRTGIFDRASHPVNGFLKVHQAREGACICCESYC